jgi:hypothetical protein
MITIFKGSIWGNCLGFGRAEDQLRFAYRGGAARIPAAASRALIGRSEGVRGGA